MGSCARPPDPPAAGCTTRRQRGPSRSEEATRDHEHSSSRSTPIDIGAGEREDLEYRPRRARVAVRADHEVHWKCARPECWGYPPNIKHVSYALIPPAGGGRFGMTEHRVWRSRWLKSTVAMRTHSGVCHSKSSTLLVSADR